MIGGISNNRFKRAGDYEVLLELSVLEAELCSVFVATDVTFYQCDFETEGLVYAYLALRFWQCHGEPILQRV
jgi:hypothetical protein